MIGSDNGGLGGNFRDFMRKIGRNANSNRYRKDRSRDTKKIEISMLCFLIR